MEYPSDLIEATERLEAFLKPEADGKQARTRERILLAATELFEAYGYRKTSVDDVAGAAGVAKGTVYLYYKNKAELLLHAIALQKQQYLVELAPAFDPQRSPAERVRELVRLGILLSQKMPLLQRSTSGDHEIEQVLRDVDAGTIAEINAQQVTYIGRLIEAAAPDLPAAVIADRAEVLVDLLFAVVNGGRQVSKGMPAESYAAIVANVIQHGILQPPGE